MYIPGTGLLWVAFLLGVASTVGFALTVRGRESGLRMARQTYVLMTAAVVVASALLMYLLINHDYRLSYIWAYSDNTLPLHYLISSFWAGQEGSFLLWVFCGVLLGLPLIRFARAYESRVMIFYNLTLLSLIILLLKQDPFRFHEGMTAGRIPMDGQGLNPLLQNPWMVIHPPVMFIGYASLAIPFAFALAALWMRRYDEWTKVSLPWVLVSLGTLGLAIMLGAYWAYETLGWGGYWGWDPVENASLVPWLATAALAHGMLLQRGRNRFRRLNLILAIAAFLLVVYATFLTRSGVLSDFSVHSFVDLGITGWLVLNIVFFLLLGLGMLLWRWREIPTEVGDEPFVSRTIFFVIGIILVILIGLIVGFGTSAPLISRLWGEPSQVGPEFYNRMGVWLAIAFSLVLGTTPFLGWRKAKDGAVRRFAVVAAITAMLAGIGIVVGLSGPLAVAYVVAALFCVIANAWTLGERARAKSWRTAGGALAHVGMGLMILAFMTTGWFNRGEKVRLALDQPFEVLGYTMTFRGVDKPTPAARDAMVVEVSAQGGQSFVLKPRMWVNNKTSQLVANPDIKSFLTKDLYLSPVEFDPGGEAPVSARVELVKGQPHGFRDWTLTFQRFDLASHGSVAGALTVGMVVELERPGQESVTLEPSLISTGDGKVQPVAVEIPGVAGARLRATGMNVDSGLIRVELLGLGGGIGRTALLEKGKTLAYKNLDVTFSDFDMSGFDPEAGKIEFGVVFHVEREGSTVELVSRFRLGSAEPVTIPGTGGITLTLGRVDADRGRVELQVIDPHLEPQGAKPMSVVVDASTKPLIGLVWLGTILVIAGIVMALMLRRRDVAVTQ